MKIAIIILSDPKSGGDDVTVLFQGAGTRWIGELSKPDHPVHDLFEAVQDSVAGVSLACTDVFGGAEEATAEGFDLVSGNEVPGTRGLPSLGALIAEGRTVLTF